MHHQVPVRFRSQPPVCRDPAEATESRQMPGTRLPCGCSETRAVRQLVLHLAQRTRLGPDACRHSQSLSPREHALHRGSPGSWLSARGWLEGKGWANMLRRLGRIVLRPQAAPGIGQGSIPQGAPATPPSLKPQLKTQAEGQDEGGSLDGDKCRCWVTALVTRQGA